MNNELKTANPFLQIENPRPLGPGSFEMALSLVYSTKIKKGMRVLEIGAGSGQVAATLAKYWDVTVVAVEPEKVGRIRTHADLQGVGNQVLPLRAKAQALPFGKDVFDAVISIGTLEMLGEDRSQALAEMIRVARPGAYIGIAEPMILLEELPYEIDDHLMMHGFKECFKTLEWNNRLFEENGRIVPVKQLYQTYSQSRLLPKLLYHDSTNLFIVYTFIKGTTRYNRGLKTNWLAQLIKELLNHYSVSHDSDVWGGIERPCASWREFLERRLKDARRNLERSLNDPQIKIEGALPIEDFNAVESLIERISEVDDKYLLHGDTGVHNFVFHDNELAGVIDPGPTLGPITYDFVYAFCSSPDDLTLEILYDAFELLKNNKIEKSRLVDEVIFQLYCQIGVCSRVHPHDLQDYLKAWEYWKFHLYNTNGRSQVGSLGEV